MHMSCTAVLTMAPKMPLKMPLKMTRTRVSTPTAAQVKKHDKSDAFLEPVFPPHTPQTYTETEIAMREEIAYLKGIVAAQGKGGSSSSSSGMWYAR